MSDIRILSETSHISMERSIATIRAEFPQAKLLTLSVHPMHDYFQDQTPPRICNCWNEYVAAIEIPDASPVSGKEIAHA